MNDTEIAVLENFEIVFSDKSQPNTTLCICKTKEHGDLRLYWRNEQLDRFLAQILKCQLAELPMTITIHKSMLDK